MGGEVGHPAGRRARSPVDARRVREPDRRIPVEGGQVVVDGVSAGRVTSVRRSEELGKVIGLAIVPHDLAVDGGRFDVQIGGKRGADDACTSARSSIPAGERLKA